MYSPSKLFIDFSLAGFSYWDGLRAISNLSIGDKLTLKAEPNNPYDPKLVALYQKDNQLGYIPHGKNTEVSQFLFLVMTYLRHM